jgi:hypothetical protein
MPKTSTKRGRYRSGKKAPAPSVWTPGEDALFSALVTDSPVTSLATRQTLARTVVESERMTRALDAVTNRSADDDGNLTRAQKSKLAALDRLRVTIKVRDEEEDL